MSRLKKIAANILAKVSPELRYTVFAYSQEGEDLILKRIFHEKRNGVYVDIGCHHPYRFSNTYLFYKRKWNGINIDPRPGTKALFDKYRPRDINLEMGVSKNNATLTYFMYDEPALNTFSREQVEILANENKHRLVKTIQVETYPLSDILQKYLQPGSPRIDFFTIDVEGLDLEVLGSNDWTNFRPAYVLIESHNASIKNIEQDDIYKFMKGVEYELFAKTYYTYIYKASQT